MSARAGNNPDETYRAGQAPDSQDEFDGQRDAAGGHPHQVRRVPPGLGDRAHSGAADALGVVLDQIEELFESAAEFGATYQRFVAERRHLDQAEASLIEANAAFVDIQQKKAAFEAELLTWHERPRIGQVQPERVHQGWTPTFADGGAAPNSEPDRFTAETTTETNHTDRSRDTDGFPDLSTEEI